METEDGTLHQVETLDDFDGMAVFLPVLEYLEGKNLPNELATERLRFHLNRGYDELYRAFERSGSWSKTLATISPSPRRGQAPGERHALPIEIEVGRHLDTSQPVHWRFNQEAGSQTNSNVRVGMPGVGKSQVLLIS